MSLSRKFLEYYHGGKEDVHYVTSRDSDFYATVSNWDSDPPKMQLYLDNKKIGIIPILDHSPNLNDLSSVNLPENIKNDIIKFLNSKSTLGFKAWEVAYDLWDTLH